MDAATLLGRSGVACPSRTCSLPGDMPDVLAPTHSGAASPCQ